MFDWFWNFFKKEDKDAPCLVCEMDFPKETMTLLVYTYPDDKGEMAKGSMYMCEPCRLKLAKEIEDEIEQDEMDFSGKEYEVDDRL